MVSTQRTAWFAPKLAQEKSLFNVKKRRRRYLKAGASIYGRWIFGTTFHWFSAHSLSVLTHRPRIKSLLLWSIQPKGHCSETSNTERLPQCDPQKDVSSVLRMMLILVS